MDSQLGIAYISLLLILLSGAAWFIFRQIIKTRQVDSAFGRLQNKLKEEKGTAQEYYELGCIYSQKKIFSQAIVLLQKALKAEDLPESEMALVYNALGFAHAEQKQFDLAIRQYKEALKLQPDYVVAFNNLGFAYEKKNLTTQALSSYESALEVDPKNATAKKRAESLRKRLNLS